MQVSVNGAVIPDQAIAAEAQNHGAENAEAAIDAAARALVVRELLLQEADRLGVRPAPERLEDGRHETEDDALIRSLLNAEIAVPDADEETCRRYYDNNVDRFRSPDLFEAAHILFAAAREDTGAYERAVRAAEQTIEELKQQPDTFDAKARERSACPSSKNGGRLGQIAKGQTAPEFETFLFSLAEGQLCPVPVKTRYGAHVLRLDRRIDGRTLPFETVRDKIAAYLEESAWRRAAAQYVGLLAGRAEIMGLEMDGATSPLVQ